MLLTNVTLATMTDDQYGLIENAALSIANGTIEWIGQNNKIPDQISENNKPFDCLGKLVTPGLIDCHTHLVYAGDRAKEFELRLQGASYEEISRSGGGIVSTVSATRRASEEQLIEQSLPRLRRIMQEGVTAIEIKSGYGLDTENEIKMLRVARQLSEITGVRIQKTFLGAHALPPEYANRSDDYINLVCQEMLPAAHQAGLVDAVDAFAENIAFSVSQVERVFATAQELGLPVKLHAEQLSNLGGAAMAAKRCAISVDHLEYLSDEDTKTLTDTVAVLLPGAFYFLKETQLPPMQALRKNKVDIAVATDCNPGSSPLTSLLLAMNMACRYFSMTPAESLKGTTINAAKALGLQDQIGSIAIGKQADLVLWNTENPAELSYNIGLNPCHRIMVQGQWKDSSSGTGQN